MEDKVPDLTPSPETVEFLNRYLPDFKRSEKISEMLKSRTQGFFDKERFPVPADFEMK